MKQLFKGQISCKAVFSKQARDSYYHGILAATELEFVGYGDCFNLTYVGTGEAVGDSLLRNKY